MSVRQAAVDRAFAEQVCRRASKLGVRGQPQRCGLTQWWVNWHVPDSLPITLQGPVRTTPQAALVAACTYLAERVILPT